MKESSKDGDLGCLFFLVVLMLFFSYGDSAFFAGFAILAAVGSVMRLWSFPRPTASIREKVRFVLSIYVAIIFAFGGLYFLEFERDPEAFSFPAQPPLEQRVQDQIQILRGSLESLNDQLMALEVLQAEGMKSPDVPLMKRASFHSRPQVHHSTEVTGLRARCEHLIVVINGRRYNLRHSTGLLDSQMEHRVREVLNASTQEQRFQAIEAIKIDLGAAREAILARIATFEPAPSERKIADFIYFSFVTMATIGYGDIYPSSTFARCLVITQSLAGIFLLGFALVAIWPQKDGKQA